MIVESFVSDDAGLPWLFDLEIGHATDAEGATHEVGYYLGSGLRSEKCADATWVTTDLRAVRLDGSDGDQTGEPLIRNVSAIAVSPDQRFLAYLTLEDGDPCGVGRMVLEVRDLSTGETTYHIGLGNRAGRRGNGRLDQVVSWLDDTRIGLALGGAGCDHWCPLSMYIVDTEEIETLRGSEPVPMMFPTVAIAGADGHLLAVSRAGDTDQLGEVLVPIPDGAALGDPTVMSIDPSTGTATTRAWVDQQRWFGIDASDATSRTVASMSISAAPDGSVLFEVVDQRGLEPSLGPYYGYRITDPSRTRLFRLTPDGVMHAMADGIVAVAVRPLSVS